MKLQRRTFLASVSAASAIMAAPAVMGRHVRVSWLSVVGPAAARLRAISPRIAMAPSMLPLIEPTKRYYTCYFSNLYLAGSGYNYDARWGMAMKGDLPRLA